MTASKRILAIVAVSTFAIALLAGCSDAGGGGSCAAGGGGVTAIQSGHYVGVASAAGKALDVDRDQRLITRTYLKDGKNVVETWAIK